MLVKWKTPVGKIDRRINLWRPEGFPLDLCPLFWSCVVWLLQGSNCLSFISDLSVGSQHIVRLDERYMSKQSGCHILKKRSLLTSPRTKPWTIIRSIWWRARRPFGRRPMKTLESGSPNKKEVKLCQFLYRHYITQCTSQRKWWTWLADYHNVRYMNSSHCCNTRVPIKRPRTTVCNARDQKTSWL
jgi:hypothetical protein